ncbi:hypothetical protein PGTUg99_023495 [Puccinia graminis f. sp. tritici]|uniref:Uncharacterized protein n=2 Tax=Puccinia graminis f. sp. tritici TaxID=56615 RepID=A0A5B0MV44_PUCGR|nr:hypothetical protein PGTUg99_023495 [Puccinia graminis f. sp. tritici]
MFPNILQSPTTTTTPSSSPTICNQEPPLLEQSSPPHCPRSHNNNTVPSSSSFRPERLILPAITAICQDSNAILRHNPLQPSASSSSGVVPRLTPRSTSQAGQLQLTTTIKNNNNNNNNNSTITKNDETSQAHPPSSPVPVISDHIPASSSSPPPTPTGSLLEALDHPAASSPAITLLPPSLVTPIKLPISQAITPIIIPSPPTTNNNSKTIITSSTTKPIDPSGTPNLIPSPTAPSPSPSNNLVDHSQPPTQPQQSQSQSGAELLVRSTLSKSSSSTSNNNTTSTPYSTTTTTNNNNNNKSIPTPTTATTTTKKSRRFSLNLHLSHSASTRTKNLHSSLTKRLSFLSPTSTTNTPLQSPISTTSSSHHHHPFISPSDPPSSINPTPQAEPTPKMHQNNLHNSLSQSITHLNLADNHQNTEPDLTDPIDPFHASSLAIQSPNGSASIIKPQRHSFWSGLGLKDRSNSRKNSSVTLAAYPNQRIYKTCTLESMVRRPSLLGPSRVIAVVGNIRRGIGRMILEELVSQKFIVVALIDKADGEFSRSVEQLASSPSLFHAFVVEGGLFGQAMAGEAEELGKVNQLVAEPLSRNTRTKAFRTFRLGSKKPPKTATPVSSATGSLGDSSITELSSHSSFISNQPSTVDAARLRSIIELKNIFQAYRVDTVICSFEPQVLDQPAGPRSKARVADEKQFGLPPAAERARIERMERTVLEASLASTAVGRFAVTVHPTSLGPCVLSPNPTGSIRSHLLSALSEDGRMSDDPPISITEFRWGFLMNDLAFDESLVDGVTAENGLGKWLCEPPKSRSVIDYERRRCLIPARTTSRRESNKKKGKHKLEPVCMTLAEDVSRFIGLACRLRDHWEWKTGKMVGDCVPGGWEEMVETIEKISKKKLDRQYVCVGSMVNGYASDSGSSNSSLEQQKQIPNVDLVDSSGMVQSCRLSAEEVYRFEDELRGNLAKQNHDASSVRLKEFVRVWYTPLPQPPSIVIDGNRLRKKSSVRGNPRNHHPVPVSPLKPQVAENGTLREVGSKAANNRKPNGPQNQFLSVPTSPPKQPISQSIGQAVSTNSSRSPAPPPLPQSNVLRVPVISPQQGAAAVQSGPSVGQEFNFIPKVVVPFNQAPSTNPHQPINTPGPNHRGPSTTPLNAPPHQAYIPPMTFQQPYQPPQQPSYPPIVGPHHPHTNTAGFPFPNQSSPAPHQTTRSSDHHSKFSVNRHPISNHHLNPPPSSSPLSPNNKLINRPAAAAAHDGNRILPRSPLAARVA